MSVSISVSEIEPHPSEKFSESDRHNLNLGTLPLNPTGER